MRSTAHEVARNAAPTLDAPMGSTAAALDKKTLGVTSAPPKAGETALVGEATASDRDPKCSASKRAVG